MKKIIVVLLSLGCLLTFAQGAAADQKAKFVEMNCNKCHAISAAGVSLAGEEEEEESAPDLSQVGKKHDAAFLKAYLSKTGEKKHAIKFKGSDAELESMANWLASLK